MIEIGEELCTETRGLTLVVLDRPVEFLSRFFFEAKAHDASIRRRASENTSSAGISVASPDSILDTR